MASDSSPSLGSRPRPPPLKGIQSGSVSTRPARTAGQAQPRGCSAGAAGPAGGGPRSPRLGAEQQMASRPHQRSRSLGGRPPGPVTARTVGLQSRPPGRCGLLCAEDAPEARGHRQWASASPRLQTRPVDVTVAGPGALGTVGRDGRDAEDCSVFCFFFRFYECSILFSTIPWDLINLI